jgi:hypothetical protein
MNPENKNDMNQKEKKWIKDRTAAAVGALMHAQALDATGLSADLKHLAEECSDRAGDLVSHEDACADLHQEAICLQAGRVILQAALTAALVRADLQRVHERLCQAAENLGAGEVCEEVEDVARLVARADLNLQKVIKSDLLK